MGDSRRRPKYEIVDGYRLPRCFSPNAYRSALLYKPRPNDLFICTFPKCGTTWMQQLVRLILHKGESFKSCLHFSLASPCIELYGADSAESMELPNAIKTHLPFYKAPYSPYAKYICVARNPKDCCVSFYYHTRYFPAYDFAYGDFDVFFDLFMKGETDFGEYFDHLLSWYKHANDSNVLFLTYEDLKRNTEMHILKIARFIGNEYYDNLQKDPNLLKTILHKSSFDYMKKNAHIYFANANETFVNAYLSRMKLPSGIKEFTETFIADELPLSTQDGCFLRKGEIGSWKQVLTPEYEKRLEEKMAKVTAGTDLMKLWF